MNERISRVLKKMEEKGITQLIVSDPLSIRFLTGIMVNPGERLYALILRTSGKHTMLLNYLYFVKDTGFEEVWFSDMEDQISIIADQIDPSVPLGIDKTWPARFLIPLQEKLPELKTVWGSDCVDGVRAVKNEEEIAIMKKASEINDAVMEKVIDFIKEGMTEKEIADFIDSEYLKAGASGTSFDTIVCFGPNAADQHHIPSETRTLKAGECILIDMGCVWQGYCSDMTRTIFAGYVPVQAQKVYDLVLKNELQTLKEYKEGASIRVASRMVENDFKLNGYDLIHSLGHGVGMEIHEAPYISYKSDTALKENMVVTNEPGIYLPGKFGVRIEDTVLINKGSCEALTKSPKGYIII